MWPFTKKVKRTPDWSELCEVERLYEKIGHYSPFCSNSIYCSNFDEPISYIKVLGEIGLGIFSSYILLILVLSIIANIFTCVIMYLFA